MTPPTPSDDAWIRSYHRLLPQLQSLVSSQRSVIPVAISRVNQFDAARLDVEMSAMLKEQLVKVFTLMKPGMLFQYEPELDAFLEFLIWRFSIWVDKPTPGNALMNLRYRDERVAEQCGKVRTGLEGPGLTAPQKIWYCVASVGGQYLFSRLQSFSAFRRWGDSEQRPLARRLWIVIQRIEGIYKAASFLNLLSFLYTGRYRNLIEKALKARLVYMSPHMNRSVSFEYMNRQLVWNEFSKESGDKKRKICGSESGNGDCSMRPEGETSSCGGGGSKGTEQKNKPEPPKDYIHVRARRGQATDRHSLAERARREKISEKMTALQDIIPGCNKIIGKALVLDEIINYIQSLQRQVEFLSMKLEVVNSGASTGPTIGIFPSGDLGTLPIDVHRTIYEQQEANEARMSQPEWLHMQVDGSFNRTT